MNDQTLRCDHCQSLIALTPGPEQPPAMPEKPRGMPPHYYHRGYAIEKPKRTYFVCQPCLNQMVFRAVAA